MPLPLLTSATCHLFWTKTGQGCKLRVKLIDIHILTLCRALGEYATANNAANEGVAKDLVNKTFGTIQDFDFQLFSANRNKQPVGKEAEAKLEQAITAMDNLLATVPADSMSRARVRTTALLRLKVAIDISQAIESSLRSCTRGVSKMLQDDEPMA